MKDLTSLLKQRVLLLVALDPAMGGYHLITLFSSDRVSAKIESRFNAPVTVFGLDPCPQWL